MTKLSLIVMYNYDGERMKNKIHCFLLILNLYVIFADIFLVNKNIWNLLILIVVAIYTTVCFYVTIKIKK